MSTWQFESVLDVLRKLPLKFHPNRVSNSWDISDIEFVWVVIVKSFSGKPNRWVEVRLGFWQQYFQFWQYHIFHTFIVVMTRFLHKYSFSVWTVSYNCSAFLLLWILATCLLRWLLWLVEYSQWGHEHGFSPVWIMTCSFMWWFLFVE